MGRVIFLHPDLGIGGAERLVVDAALALKSKGHYVHIITSHHDPNHSFPETNNGEIPVTISGSWLPRSMGGRFLALFAYIRMIWAALYAVFFSKLNPDVYFCDQISACIPILKMFSKTPVLFYCHFPDLLLASHKNWSQKIYRLPLDWVEEKSTGKADAVVVNSNFTAGIFQDTFLSLKIRPLVLYPSLNFDTFDRPTDQMYGLENVILDYTPDSFVFLSINRYERKKKIELAIQSFGLLLSNLMKSSKSTKKLAIHLIIAGGYDARVRENVEYYNELQILCLKRVACASKVTFLRSPDDDVKTMLLKSCHTLLYTPDREHFGIVPLEAMYCALPVIAVNSGGPLETVKDNKTGYLCPQDPEEFASRMNYLCLNREEAKKMGEQGKRHVTRHFSFKSFSNQLDNLIQDCNKR